MRGIPFHRAITGSRPVLTLLILFYLHAAASADDAGLYYPHYAVNNIGCLSCHYAATADPPEWLTHEPQDLDDTPYNNLCRSCHNEVIAPEVQPHSSLTTSDQYHQAEGGWAIECRSCHWSHHQYQSVAYGAASYLYSGVSTAVNGTTLTKAGAGWSDDQFNGNILIPNTNQPSYTYRITDTTSDTLTVATSISHPQPIDLTRAAVGHTFAIIYGKLIRPYIPTPNSGYRQVRFYNSTGAKSLADGDATKDGVCEVCHTATRHFRNSGAINALPGGYDHTSAAGTDCISCHPHTTGFSHGGAGGAANCEECHGHDEGFGGFTGGKGSYLAHSTHTENDPDDLKGPQVTCAECHDTNNFPSFTSGTDSNADGVISLAETDVCDACHSPGGTHDGVDDAVIGAKSNWSAGIYRATDDSTLRSGKEKWCAGCHDEEPSVISGVTAPNVIGDEDGAFTYGSGWGYYKTGHGLETATTYPASGGVSFGAGKACSACHDLATAHIDGAARTYSSGSDNYQAGYRLVSINGWEPMNIPRANGPALDADDFKLCFNAGCHDSNKYLRQPATNTSFRDDVGNGRDSGDPPPINAHEYHLDNLGIRFDSDWEGGTDSQVTCVTCHNVHGSTQHSMIRDGKLVGREPGLVVYYEDDGSALTSVTPPSPTNVTLNNSIATSFLESSTTNLCTPCHGGNFALYYRSAPGAQQAPTLDWTGEANYAADGVDPDSGQGGDYYTFRIKYSDANFQIPKSIQVWVDQDDSGTYESGEKYDLLAVDSSDINVADGKVYRRILNLSRAGDGTLSYRFYATDGPDEAAGAPADPVANTLTIINNAPVLTWSGETGYEADGVNPGSGADGGSFTFRVQYGDADNQAPTTMQVWIDRNDDGDYLDGEEKLDLTAVEAGDTYYADGKRYATAVTLAAAGDGSLSYRFYAADGSDDAGGTPTGNLTVGVNAVNSAPTLAWTNEPHYVGNGVDPDADIDGTTFTFRIRYADSDNNPPAPIQLWLDANDDEDFNDPGEKIDMAAVAADDSDYSDGKLFTVSTAVTEAGDGILSYRFAANDGTVEAGGAPTNSSLLTILVGAIKVSCDGTGDFDYTTIQAAIDNATDGDTIVVADGICSEAITIDNKDLTIKSVNGAAATTMDGNGAPTVVTMQNGADTTLQGLTITGGNRGAGYGAGVSISSSSATIANSIISGNSSQYATAVYLTGSGSTATISETTVSGNTSTLNGPGIYLASGTSAAIIDSTISNNSTPNGTGGGIYMTTSADASLTVSGSTFSDNTVTAFGGGIYVGASGGTVTVDVEDTTFSGNGAQRGGAIYATDSGAACTLTITDNLISTNSASIEGGALHLNNLDATSITGTTLEGNTSQNGGALKHTNSGANTLTMSDCTLRDNVASGSYGGALWVSGGTSLLERCTIAGNSANQRGGAAYLSGTSGATADTTVTNCLITGNLTNSFEGGGLFCTDDGTNAHTVTLLNSTFAGNNAGGAGGGIHVGGTTAATAKNTIFWRNRGGATTAPEISGTLSTSYCDIRQSGYEGSNNINADPLFINAVRYTDAPTSSGNHHLLLSSPALDLGTTTDAPAADIDGNLRPLGNGVDMGADEVMSVANNAPTLSWSGEAGFSSDGSAPDQGSSGTSFEFRVSFADTDNHAPAAIQLWIDENDNGTYEANEKYPMNEVDGGDANYADGKLYTRTIDLAYAGDGALSYRFYANDAIEVATGAAVTGATVVINDAPTLAWLGSGDYTADGVHPDSAASGSSFEFRVRYSDLNNHAPSAIQLWIDRNDDDDYLDSGEQLTMAEYNPSDNLFSDGKDYFRVLTLTTAGDNTLKYRFYASDGDPATGAPTVSATVSLVNNAPTLAWVGSGNFTTDGVHPNNAVGGSGYEFRVSYADADNQAPTAIQIWIDKNDDDDYLDAEEKLEMTEVDGGDDDFTDGKLYTHSLTLSSAGSGDGYLNYRFQANDGTDEATGNPLTAKLVGVFAANHPPDLDWSGEAGYVADGVNPDSGAEGDTFTFRVKYTDIENSPPTVIQVWVDLDDDGTAVGDEGSELFALSEVNAGDTVYDDGKLFTAEVVIASAGDGTILYHFAAADGTDNGTGNATVNQTVTLSAPVTVCLSGCDHTTIQAAIDASSSGDFILVKDGAYPENLNFIGKNLTVYSENGAASTSITGTGANAAVVTFGSGETSAAVLDGFTIDNAGTNTATRGISIAGATPTIKNSIIEGNDAPNAAGGGGGVYISNSTPTFDTCVLRANSTLNRAGGGVYITGAAGGATIVASTFGGDNAADRNYSNNGRAGAIYFENSTTGTLTITNSTFKNNQCATDGAGLYLTGITSVTTITGSNLTYNTTTGGNGSAIYANNAPVRITNSHLDNNAISTIRSGGGVYMIGAASSLVIEGNSTVSNNASPAARAALGAAIYLSGSTAATPLAISDTTMANNHAITNGGAVYLSTLTNTSTCTNVTFANNTLSNGNGGGLYAISAPLHVTDSTFSGNSAPATRIGGGLYLETTSATISATQFETNSAGYGGGLGIGGTTPSLALDKVEVQGNSAPNGGGGIRIAAGTATITNTLITGNNVDTDYRYGGGISNSGTLYLYHSTIAGNYVLRDGGGVDAGGTETIRNSIIFGNIADSGSLDSFRGTVETVDYSDVEGGYAGSGNIDTDPLFVNFQQAGIGVPTADGDFRLTATSACIDTASATDAPADDLDANARPHDIPGKGDGVDDYDMGAYEYAE